MMVLTVPAVLRKSPALENVAGAVATLAWPSKVISKVALARLLNTALLPAVILPASQVPVPPLFKVRPVRVALPLMVRTPPPPMLVTPVPDMVPPDQSNVPKTLRSPAPVSVLPATVSSNWPLALTTLAPFKVRMALPTDKVCVPLLPPSVTVPTALFAPIVTMYVPLLVIKALSVGPGTWGGLQSPGAFQSPPPLAIQTKSPAFELPAR